jgi:hypothetical protein
MYLRFAAVEVVRPEFSSLAVAWTLCGGCLAAFVGPETAAATTGVFGEDNKNLTFLGVFVVAMCFTLAQALFVGLVKFETQLGRVKFETQLDKVPMVDMQKMADDGDVEFVSMKAQQTKVDGEKPTVEEAELAHTSHPTDCIVFDASSATETGPSTVRLASLLKQPNFILPLLTSILSWSIMAMPMR